MKSLMALFAVVACFATSGLAFDLVKPESLPKEYKELMFPDPSQTGGDVMLDEALAKKLKKPVEIIVVGDEKDPHYNDKNNVCKKLYTKSIRAVTPAMSNEVYSNYTNRFEKEITVKQDINKKCKNGKSEVRCFEVDHYLSLELGGSNCVKSGDSDTRPDAAGKSEVTHSCKTGNLWPQPYNPSPDNKIPGARLKDQVEDELKRRVCSGQMDIHDAQGIITGKNPLTGKAPVIEGKETADWYTFFYYQMFLKDQAKFKAWENTDENGVKTGGLVKGQDAKDATEEGDDENGGDNGDATPAKKEKAEPAKKEEPKKKEPAKKR